MGTTIIEANLPEEVDRGERGEAERARIVNALKGMGVDVRVVGTTIQVEAGEDLLPRVESVIEASRANVTNKLDKGAIDMDEEL